MALNSREQVILQQELISNLQKDLKLKQCQQGYIRLPVVPKMLYKGPRDALYYINQKGNRVYLKRDQKQKLQENKLLGVVGAPQGVVEDYDPNEIPQSVFRRVNQNLQLAQVMY
jgi:hypothetical protein